MVRSSLDGLITAYEAKSGSHFSGLVSDSYQGEKRVLDKAVMRDFGTFHNLSIRYTVNNITLGDNGMVSVAITFTRGWTDIKTTNTMSETRETSLVFVLEDNVYRLLSQGRPQLFGFN